MSRLYLRGSTDRIKTERTACGDEVVVAHISGWDFGVRVVATAVNDENIMFSVTLTGGSNDPHSGKPIANMVYDEIRGRVVADSWPIK